MASWKKVIVSGSAAELSTLTLDTALPVAQGGIGATSLTDKAVLISQDSGTDAVGAVALTSNGQLIIGGADGPAAATLTGTSNEITVTNAANAITLSLPDDVTIGQDLIVTRNLKNSSAVGSSHITGSFTGSFTGDGSGISGVSGEFPTTPETGVSHDALKLFVSDGGSKFISGSNFAEYLFAKVSGDAAVAAGGALTIAANSVEGTMLNTNSADTTTLELSSDTLSVLKVPNALTVDNATIQLNSGTTFDGSGAKTIAIKDGGVDEDALATSVAGDGLTGGGGSALAVGAGTGIDVSSNAIAVDVSDFMANGSNNRIVTATGTDGQNAEANLTFDGTTLNVVGAATITGNLTVNGSTTSISSSNLLIADRFALFNSGSSATGDGGFLVGSGSAGSGSAFIFDDSEDRFGVQVDTQLGQDAVSGVPEAYASLYVLTANTGSATYNVKGNIKTDDGTGDIFIYS
tara:strand:- start:3219 stop:4607 length:1389 start_codon:yes stop_codon:yes gene_type:complete